MFIMKKFVFAILFALLVPGVSFGQSYFAQPTRLALFSGGSTVELFFRNYQGTNTQRVLMYTNNGYSISNNYEWIRSGMQSAINHNGYARLGNGQCTDFVKHMTNNFNPTSYWTRGDHVASYWDRNALIGKVIATFNSSGQYANNSSSHTAVILDAWKENGSNTINAVFVVDQNWIPTASIYNGGSIGKHEIRTGGSGVNNLNNYYLVR